MKKWSETVSQEQAAEPALVIIALNDEARSAELSAALARSDLPVKPVTARSGADIEAQARSGKCGLVLAMSTLGGEGTLELMNKLRTELNSPPRCVAVFMDKDDEGRAAAARTGIIDFVLSERGVDEALVALVGRLVTRDLLEARLDATTFRFRTLVENSNDGIYILRAGEFVYVNPRFEEMVGYSAQELLDSGFSIENSIIAEESRAAIETRRHRVEQGLPVEPRYEFVVRRKDGAKFDAEVSVSYIEFEGFPASLGIMQDITERKKFEEQLVRKNRELALLNDLANSINHAVRLDDILRIGCHEVFDLLHVGGAGIVLITPDGETIELMVSEGLSPTLNAALQSQRVDGDSLIATAIRQGEIQRVLDLATDGRIVNREVRESGFEGALVVPVKARAKILGAAFVFAQRGRRIIDADEELMRSIGVLLGTAIEKASLLEQEQAAVKRLRALDAVALAVSSSLDTRELAQTVARSVQNLFDPKRMLIGEYDANRRAFVPLCIRDRDDEEISDAPVSADASVLKAMLARRAPVQDVCSEEDGTCFIDGELTTEGHFLAGLGALVGVPVLADGDVVGVIALGYDTPRPLDPRELESLSTLSTHVSIALKNAALFAARNRALDDLKQAQAKLVKSEKLRALGELAAGVAHDFNNVLGAILGRVQLLKAQAREPTVRHHALIIEKAATDGAETVRRIQELGRQESTDDFIPVRVGGILKDVAELTQPRWRDRTRLEGRAVDLEVDIVDELWVEGNPHELREVLINLVNNAVDALPEGGGVLLVARERGGLCEISVSDNGTGMPDEVAERIFDPFFTTKGDKGTGLGLSVSYSIIRRHGGDIEVESSRDESGHGTTFSITLPRIETPANPDLHTSEIDLEIASASKGEPPASDDLSDPVEDREPLFTDAGPARVLVIDDEENIRDILTDILALDGYEVVCVGDGQEGLARLEQERFDMVLTDLGLPGMTGYEVASAVKARRPRLPVGLVTGWGANLDENRARQHGIDLVLSKPFRFDQVLGLVRDTLERRRDAP